MARERRRTAFICQECGYEAARWEGRCPSCGSWNTLIERTLDPGRGRWHAPTSAEPVPLAEVERAAIERLTLPGREFNRVLGGGIVPGSLILVGGDPGIGKSTLLLQASAALAEQGRTVLYVCGEESPQQVRLRADRLGLRGEGMVLYPETNLNAALALLERYPVALMVVDSLQTVFLDEVPSPPGSLAQMRECTLRLLRAAKERHTPMFLIGHVTKEGTIAGPRAVEHMVDVVLYLEGERASAYRLLRAVKNRFGSVDEVGVFEMQEQGMMEVENPSAAFLAERAHTTIGSAVVPLLQGTRPLLVEVQALTSPAGLGPPRRIANGFDFNRLLMLIAVLTQRAGLSLGSQDVIVNIVGGLRVEEPAADLAVSMAIASSARNAPVDPTLVAIGEVGLSGELRGVTHLERRLHEATTLGFHRALIAQGRRGMSSGAPDLQVIEARTLQEALRLGLQTPRRKRALAGEDALDPLANEDR